MSATIHRLKPRSRFEDGFAAYPETGRRRTNRKEAMTRWASLAGEIGEDALLASVKRYVVEDKDHKRECGAPAFERWLKWGRWEHWLPVQEGAPAQAEKPKFSDPLLRASFVERFPDERAHRWFDACRLDGRDLVSRTRGVRQEWVQGPFRQWALANQITALRFE